MGSLEDLRDYYKSCNKSTHLNIKSNGSTYSNAYKSSIYNHGNTIRKKNSNYAENQNEFDEKYGIKTSLVTYSLNKKGRWKLADDLKRNMSDFANDEIDVRVYESRNRIRGDSHDLIEFTQSKGDKIKVQSTYANANAIRKGLDAEAAKAKNSKNNGDDDTNERKRNRDNNRYTIRKEPKTSRKTKLNNNSQNNERILIDLDEDDTEGEYTEYDIEYPPTMEVLKYNTVYETKIKDRVVSRITKNVLGDEFNKKNLKNIVNEKNGDDLYDIDYNEDEEYEDEENGINAAPTQTMTLLELISSYTKPIVERRNTDIIKKKTSKVDENEVRKLIYISRQNSKIDSKANSALSRPNSAQSTKKSKQTDKQSKIETLEPIILVHSMTESSLNANHLRSKFSLKYNEAVNVWPRIISINISDDVTEELSYQNKVSSDKYNVKAWLSVREIPNLKCEKDSNAVYVPDTPHDIKDYQIKIKINLNNHEIDTSSLDSINSNDFDDVYQRLVHFIASLPLQMFKLKEKIVVSEKVDENCLNEELPTIAVQSVCKEIEELKLDYASKNEIESKEESTSDTISKNSDEDEFDEVKAKERLDKMFLEQTCSCYLCFDEHLSIADCTILKNCAHSVCNTCWTNYIDSRCNNAFLSAGKLFCPVCDNEVDFALIADFVSNIENFDQFLTISVERIFSIMKSYKWCQSPYCKKAIKIDLLSTPYGIASCECGYKKCLKCNMQPHFPAKCSQIAAYYRELKAKNHNLMKNTPQAYTGVGKRCPACGVFMEKNGGCNQMYCTVCRESFCWQCSKIWSEHLKLTNGQHGCVVTGQNNLITVEFKKDKNPVKPHEASSYYQNSIYHRELRSKANLSERSKRIKRLLGSIKSKELFTLEESLAKMSLHDECKLEIEKRNEARQFLQKMLSFLNELHFVCEHSYVLLKDSSINKVAKIQFLNVLMSLEIIIWKIEYNFDDESRGITALNELKDLMKKGLNCLNVINNLKL